MVARMHPDMHGWVNPLRGRFRERPVTGWHLALGLAPASLVFLLGPLITLTVLLGAYAVLGLFMSPFFRLMSLTLGALVTFQSSSNALRLVFLLLVGLCLAFAIYDLTQSASRLVAREWRVMLVGSAAAFMYLLLTGPLAVTRGNTILDWARDVAPVLFAVSFPVIGMELGRKISYHRIIRLFVVVGVLSTVSFVLQWLTNRDVLAIGRITFGDDYLTASLFALCAALAAQRTTRVKGQVAIAVVFGCVLLTGNRSLLALGLGLLGVVGSTRRKRMKWTTLAATSLVLIGGLLLVVQVASTFIPGEKAFLYQRVQVTQRYLQTGQDQSAQSRSVQTAMASQEFRKHPVFGAGPGHLYLDPYYLPGVSDPRRNRGSFFTLDTPMKLPAEYGILGICVLLGWLGSLVACATAWIRRREASLVGNALRAFAWISIGFLPFAITIEEKGFAIATCLFLAALVSRDADGASHVGIQGVTRTIGFRQT